MDESEKKEQEVLRPGGDEVSTGRQCDLVHTVSEEMCSTGLEPREASRLVEQKLPTIEWEISYGGHKVTGKLDSKFHGIKDAETLITYVSVLIRATLLDAEMEWMSHALLEQAESAQEDESAESGKPIVIYDASSKKDDEEISGSKDA